MNTVTISNTDSIEELARFWDTHDLADFEDQLQEVAEPVFERRTVITIRLAPKEVKTIEELARSKGLGSAELVREWVLERIAA